ncbi:Hint domain-containing protein [Thalassococcus sp. S3]|uniref:Hint domain-containing protein n=1 Tax=Thalassococcus sp. S3 TaxID=2017482 RepID=UPI0010243972|nr:Hint domain-containing protein [Thalassococcus sp. S3]QBF31025.1 hypothetical protein CFI11_07300 [Thalassococcus sp. S3]
MPDYSLFVLDESDLTISGGVVLDGVNQGDGSHLVGQTITLNTPAWTEIQIRDDDTDFSDNDSSQRLDGAQEVDGTVYADNTTLEAEYGLTLSDGVNTWQVVGFNVNNSSTAYATVEGLAFIGGPGGFPPVGVPLTVVSAQEGPDYEVAQYATPICYDRGTLIETRRGLRPVETLKPGVRIRTAEGRFRPLRWIEGQHVIGVGRFAPVEIPGRLTGTGRSLRVSQQHCLAVQGPDVALLFDAEEVFIRALHLVGYEGARLCNGVRAEYFHVLLDHHEVIYAEGLASESLHPGTTDDLMAQHIRAMRPDLAKDYGPTARRVLRRHEAALLMQRARLIDLVGGLRHSA